MTPWIPKLEWSINLGQIVLTGTLGLVWWMIRRGIREFKRHMWRINTMEGRIEANAERTDEHSDVLLHAGWARGRDWEKLAQKRRASDTV